MLENVVLKNVIDVTRLPKTDKGESSVHTSILLRFVAGCISLVSLVSATFLSPVASPTADMSAEALVSFVAENLQNVDIK